MPQTILIVDDSTSMRQMVSFTLNEVGYLTMEAADGQDALAKLTAGVNLVISDLNMPRIDGLQLVRQIRAGSPNRYVPILILTTESQSSRRQEARAAGATAWIVKPFRPDQLISVVRKLLG